MWKNFLLTRVETSTPDTFATALGFKLRRLIKPALRPILRLASGRRIHVESYQMMYRHNRGHEHEIALSYFGNKITYGELFARIEKTAKAFLAIGVKKGDVVDTDAVLVVIG